MFFFQSFTSFPPAVSPICKVAWHQTPETGSGIVMKNCADQVKIEYTHLATSSNMDILQIV